MKPGTPFFVGGRLLEAREARGLSAAALADLVDVRRETIYQIEAGRITPGPALFARLQQTLRMPPAFFFEEDDNKSEEADLVLFRSMRSAAKPARQRARRRLRWLKRVTQFAEEFVDLPPFDVPDYGFPGDPVAIRDNQIEEVADDLRRRWSLGNGPISNVTWLIENHGIIVAREDLGADELDAAILRSSGKVFVLLGADKGTDVRSRMDAAHELGHIVIHRNCPPPTSEKDPLHKLMEEQAFRFAGSFLLPEESFANEVWSCTLDELLALKAKWRVAVAAMIMRAASLRLISKPQEGRLWRQYSSRKWKKGEPYDDEWSPEQPFLLRRSFEMMLESKVVSIDRVLNEIKLPATDIEVLAGLPHGTISNGPSPISFRKNEPGVSNERNNIVSFQRGSRPVESSAPDHARS